MRTIDEISEAVHGPTPVCEVERTVWFVRQQVYGHWGGFGCACPTPPEAPAAHLTDAQACRLVDLIVKFAYRVHTPEEQTEMFSLTGDQGDRRLH